MVAALVSRVTIRDLGAAVFGLVSLLGVIVLAIGATPVPPELTALLGLAAGYFFRGVENGGRTSRPNGGAP